jgi:nicotinate-nucleotide pyrophosphorylase (carboxylating)
MRSFLKENDIRPIIILALKEDIGHSDITTNAIFKNNGVSQAVIIANEEGIFCGGEVVKMIFNEIDSSVKISILAKDGKNIKKGDKLVKISGRTKSLLIGERICLNFAQRMSGIATKTYRITELLKNSGIDILDTRKTAPGLRLLDKYSVKCGGGKNHRMGLFDMVLIKNNHIKAAGNITKAINAARNAYGKKYKIEVEARTLEEVKEAVKCKPDIIMLDNMDKGTMKKAIDIINKKSKIEVSGNIEEWNIQNISDLKINFVSIGGLTHSVKAFDLSMRFI